VELRRLTTVSEPGDVAAAFDRLIARRERKAYCNRLSFSRVDLSGMRDAYGRKSADGDRKSVECPHASSPVHNEN
jgi:hypothetical protein